MKIRAAALSMLLALASLIFTSAGRDVRYRTMMLDGGVVAGGRGQADPRLASILRIVVETDGMVQRGSGAWTDRGVYTAWHVVKDAVTVTVYDAKGAAHVAWGWWRLGGGDAALVRLDEPLTGVEPLRVAREPLAGAAAVPADVLAYWGQGADQGLVGTASGTVMLALQAIPSAARELGGQFYGTTIPIVPGMSGAPMVVDGVIYAVVSHLVPGRAAYMARVDRASCPPLSPVRVKPAVPIHASRSAPVTQDPRWGRQPVPRLAPVTPKDCKT